MVCSDATVVNLIIPCCHTDYSAWSKSVHPNAYKSGLHFIGAAHHFIRYPTTLQSIVFSQDNHNLLKTRTSDGLPITLGAR